MEANFHAAGEEGALTCSYLAQDLAKQTRHKLVAFFAIAIPNTAMFSSCCSD